MVLKVILYAQFQLRSQPKFCDHSNSWVVDCFVSGDYLQLCVSFPVICLLRSSSEAQPVFSRTYKLHYMWVSKPLPLFWEWLFQFDVEGLFYDSCKTVAPCPKCAPQCPWKNVSFLKWEEKRTAESISAHFALLWWATWLPYLPNVQVFSFLSSLDCIYRVVSLLLGCWVFYTWKLLSQHVTELEEHTTYVKNPFGFSYSLHHHIW